MQAIKQFVHLYFPPVLKQWVRNFLLKNRRFLKDSFIYENVRATPFDEVEQKFIKKIFKYLYINVPLLLQIREVRQLLAKERLLAYLKQQKINSMKEQPMGNAFNT